MNKNAAIGTAAVLGLVIGFALGWMVSPDEGEGPIAKFRERGGGPQGPTPSTAAGEIPNGTWSKVNVGQELGVELLDDIQELALDALAAEPPQIDQMMFDQINEKLLACAVNEPPFPGSENDHKTALMQAKQAAMQGNWPEVLAKMTSHGH